MTDFLDKLLDTVVWESLPDSVSQSYSDSPTPRRGILRIDDFEIAVYRCSNGEVAFDCEDIERFFAGCPLCHHSSRCPDCNPTPADRARERVGVLLSQEVEV